MNNEQETKTEESSLKDTLVKISDNVKHNYVVLMETNEKDCESWYYFIKYQGNVSNLEYLKDQLNEVDWYILDNYSTFDLDLEHFVSENTAKEMTKIEVNCYCFHRKFDGVLQKIDLRFKKKEKNKKKIRKTFDILGRGKIEEFIDEEDIDDEDLTDSSEDSSSEDNESLSSGEESSSGSPEKQITKIPPLLLNNDKKPGWVKAKQKKKKNN
jgi:hypothetical protein